MSCIEVTFDGANDSERCKCRGAVLRAYKELLSAGHPEVCAMQAAKIVYHYHHPEDPKDDAALTVERWVSAETGRFH